MMTSFAKTAFDHLLTALGASRTWFRAFRRTRPFWGGLWLALGGAWIVKLMSFPIGMAVGGGWDTSAGYILGGGMVLFAMTAWFAPFYAQLSGILGVLIALAAFVAANLGGLLIGTFLGIIGGSMIWAWGEKAPRANRGERSMLRRLKLRRIATRRPGGRRALTA